MTILCKFIFKYSTKKEESICYKRDGRDKSWPLCRRASLPFGSGVFIPKEIKKKSDATILLYLRVFQPFALSYTRREFYVDRHHRIHVIIFIIIIMKIYYFYFLLSRLHNLTLLIFFFFFGRFPFYDTSKVDPRIINPFSIHNSLCLFSSH